MAKRTNSELNGATETDSNAYEASDLEVGEITVKGSRGITSVATSPLPYIPTGRRFDLKYEPSSGVTLDGGDPLVRMYSPFVLQYLPPADAQVYIGDMKKSRTTDLSENLNTFADALANNFDVTSSYDGAVTTSSYNSLEALAQQQVYRNLSSDEKGLAESSFVGSAQTLSYISQLFALMNLPPLQFLINPNSMSITYTKIQDFSARTRKNRVFKAWGEDQPKITFSAQTGGFIAQSGAGNESLNNFFTLMNTANSKGPSGMQYASKRQSLAFQHFMEILQMYQNACLIYDKIFDTEAHLGVGSFLIHYDQMTYEGLIESFDYSYQEDTPNGLSFNFDFTVSKMYDWNSQQGSPQRIQPPSFDADSRK